MKSLNDFDMPVEAKEEDAIPVTAQYRWRINEEGHLQKLYEFLDIHTRSKFVSRLFGYENKTKHCAKILTMGTKVSLEIWTKNIDTITNIDKEYASYADGLYKDILYYKNDEEE